MSSPDSLPPVISGPPELPVLPAPRRKRRVLPVVLTLLSLPFVLYGGFILFYVAGNASAEAKIRARGEPVTSREVAAAQPKVPDDQNAAIPLMALWRIEDPKHWEAFESGKSMDQAGPGDDVPAGLPLLGKAGVKLPASDPLPKAMLDQVAAHVARREGYRAAVRKALERPHCIFPIQHEAGFGSRLPHLSRIKNTHSEFRLAFVDALNRRDTTEAIAHLEDMERLARLLAEDVNLISHLIRLVVCTGVVEGVERLVSAAPLDAADLARVERLLASTNTGRHLAACLRTERAAVLDAMEMSAEQFIRLGAADGELSESDQKMVRVLRVSRALGLRHLDRARLLEFHEQMASALEKDPAGGAAGLGSLLELLREGNPFLHPITLMMIKPVERAGTRSARMEALRRCAVAVVEVERFRAANGGRLPTSLEELPAPTDRSLRTDPFGDSLKYRVLEVGYVVYSVGPDRVDDGGVPKRPSRERSTPQDAAIVIRR
jgi:hypothetical protein